MPRKSVDNEKACQAIIPGIIHSPKPSFLFCMVIPQMPENMPIEAHCQRSRGINACSAPLYLIEQCVINRNTIFIYKRHRKNWCQCFKFFRTFSKMVDSISQIYLFCQLICVTYSNPQYLFYRILAQISFHPTICKYHKTIARIIF